MRILSRLYAAFLIVGLLTTPGVKAEKVTVTVFYAEGTHGYPRWVQAGLDQFNEGRAIRFTTQLGCRRDCLRRGALRRARRRLA